MKTRKTERMMNRPLLTRLPAVLALLSLTACDVVARRDFRRERESGSYQTAMADYKAGRIAQAAEGFRKACREDPGNASARFQLACILQDGVKDHLGAYCAYLEFLSQQPESDKAQLARNRAAICEREVAKVLAEKHGLTDTKAMLQELETVRSQLKDAEKRNAKLSDDVAVTMQRVAHLLDENARLKAAIKGDEPETSVASAGIRDAKALLDEDDGDRMKVSDEIRKLRNEPDEDGDDGRKKALAEVKKLRGEPDEADDGDRIRRSADIAALRQASEADEALATSSSTLLPAQGTNVVRKAAAKPAPARPSEPPPEKRPAEYTVQEGDTLYKIAMRFYGKSSAWKIIRDANKAVISTDGRVMSGMKIKLPEPTK